MGGLVRLVVIAGTEPGAVGVALGMGWMGGLVGFVVIAGAGPGAIETSGSAGRAGWQLQCGAGSNRVGMRLWWCNGPARAVRHDDRENGHVIEAALWLVALQARGRATWSPV